MIIKEVRQILGSKYDLVPDETLIEFTDLIEAIISYIVSIELSQDSTEYKQNENHEP